MFVSRSGRKTFFEIHAGVRLPEVDTVPQTRWKKETNRRYIIFATKLQIVTVLTSIEFKFKHHYEKFATSWRNLKSVVSSAVRTWVKIECATCVSIRDCRLELLRTCTFFIIIHRLISQKYLSNSFCKYFDSHYSCSKFPVHNFMLK